MFCVCQEVPVDPYTPGKLAVFPHIKYINTKFSIRFISVSLITPNTLVLPTLQLQNCKNLSYEQND